MNRLLPIVFTLLLVASVVAPVSGQNLVAAYGTVAMWGGDPCDPPIAQAWASSNHTSVVTRLFGGYKGDSLLVNGQLKRHTNGCLGYAIRRGTCQGIRRITTQGQSVSCQVPALQTACNKGHRAWTQARFSDAPTETHYSNCDSVQCETCLGCE